MRIKLLEMTNFRNIKLNRLEFSDKQFTVLIGDNGTGKTAIIEGITKGFVPVIRAVNSEAVKNCDLNNRDIACGTAATTVTLKIELDDEEYTWTNRRRLSSLVEFDPIIENKDKVQHDLKQLKSKYIKRIEEKRLPLVLYYGTDRIIREVPVRGHIKNFEVTDSLRNCFDNANYFRDFYDWFKTEEDMELRELRSSKSYRNPRLDCVRHALEKMIKGYKNLRIELNPSRMLMTNSEGMDLQIEQLSGGYKAVLSVVADIAKRLSLANPEVKNPLEEEAVILIDELDLHLHPKWQKTIVDDLKRTFPNCQFIISTHSPFIIQSIGADELFDIESMGYAGEGGNFGGWSIESIQEKKMGVKLRTEKYNDLITTFSKAIDNEEYENAKHMYEELVKMMNPDSSERRIIDMDMEMANIDDKADKR